MGIPGSWQVLACKLPPWSAGGSGHHPQRGIACPNAATQQQVSPLSLWRRAGGGATKRIAFIDGRFNTVSRSHPCSPRVRSGMVREVGQDVGAPARGRSLLRSAALKKNDTETF